MKYANSWFAHAGENDAQETLSAPDGYVAPSLNGVWPSPPYLHKGSVPTLWNLFDPEQRPLVWRPVATKWIRRLWGYQSRKVRNYGTVRKFPSASLSLWHIVRLLLLGFSSRRCLIGQEGGPENHSKGQPPDEIVRHDCPSHRQREAPRGDCPDKADRPEDLTQQTDKHNRPVSKRIPSSDPITDPVDSDDHSDALP